MAETIDEAMLVAWVDGELDAVQAARVAQAVAIDPGLAALAERHRRMRARFAAAFDRIADQPAPLRSAPVISLAAVRAEREAKTAPPPRRRGWGVGGAIAASLVLGVFAGHGLSGRSGLTDRPGALALSGPIAQALDGQLSGDAGAVRVALSFKDRDGDFCRSFAAANLSGVACRGRGDWQLRYASPAATQSTDYRMAGGDGDEMRFIQSAIAGDPLDRDAERTARANRWRH